MKKIIAVISSRGLPASYGGFETLVNYLTLISEKEFKDYIFLIGCEMHLKKNLFYRRNVKRIFASRFDGIGALIFDLKIFFKCLFYKPTSFLYLGYTSAPFFSLLSLLGINIVCNVDGFEWRRKKWGKLAKKYLKFCEYICGISKSTLISDSLVIQRYYRYHFNKKTFLIRYGGDITDQISNLEIKNYYLVVMRLEPENNIEVIFNSFMKSKSKKKLVIIGNKTKYFMDKIYPYIDKSRINFLGPVYEKVRLAKLRSETFCYIHGHTVGGTNPSLVEACKFQRPIIAYKSLFNKEVLGKKALFFKSMKDLKNIFEEKYEFLKPPKLGEDYDWNYITKEYIKLL